METKCIEIRRQLTTDPKTKDPNLLEHLSECAACSDYLQDQKKFANKLSVAMNIDVPEGLASRIILAKEMGYDGVSPSTKKHNYSWMSMAAGLLLVVGLSIGMYRLGQVNSLEDQILAHVNNELFALEKDENIQLAALNIMLKQHGLKANDGIGYVRFAENCSFGEKIVPHFILEDDGRLITVIYFPWETVDGRIPVDDDRFKGYLVAADKGSFVILADKQEYVHEFENQIISAIEVKI